ncbi:MAG TPA: sugar phosphate isomerase/epimerase family protein [Candidatus Dormibacteraeota bacterium]
MSDRWPLSAFGDEAAADLEEQVRALREEGIGHVEFRAAWGVNVVELGPDRLDAAARVLREAGIGVSAIASPVGKAPLDGDPSDELGRLSAALDAADRLGTSLVRVFSFHVPDGRYDEHRDEVLRRMTALAELAARRGATLVHENESHIYGDTAERCRDLVESVGSPALRIAFDPANFVQCGVRPMAEAWPLLREHVTHVHIKDAVSVERDAPYPAPAPPGALMLSVRPAGEGDGEVLELLRELDRTGYRGYLTLEPHLHFHSADLDGPGRLHVATAALRRLLAELP